MATALERFEGVCDGKAEATIMDQERCAERDGDIHPSRRKGGNALKTSPGLTAIEANSRLHGLPSGSQSTMAGGNFSKQAKGTLDALHTHSLRTPRQVVRRFVPATPWQTRRSPIRCGSSSSSSSANSPSAKPP